MKRGQGTTFSLEEFVKLAMSVFIAGILLTVIATVYLWWASPQISEHASSLNEYENLIGLIQAKEGDDWETKTVIHLGFGSYIEGFSEGESTAQDEDSSFTRPDKCEGTCICLYSKDVEDEQKEAYPVRCDTVDANNVLLEGSPNPVCDLFTVKKESGLLSISIVEECEGDEGLMQRIRAWFHS